MINLVVSIIALLLMFMLFVAYVMIHNYQLHHKHQAEILLAKNNNKQVSDSRLDLITYRIKCQEISKSYFKDKSVKHAERQSRLISQYTQLLFDGNIESFNIKNKYLSQYMFELSQDFTNLSQKE